MHLLGCDTVSGFNKKGKKKALYIWKIFPASTPVFIALSNAQSAIAEEWGTILERFVVLLIQRQRFKEAASSPGRIVSLPFDSEPFSSQTADRIT